MHSRKQASISFNALENVDVRFGIANLKISYGRKTYSFPKQNIFHRSMAFQSSGQYA